MVSKSQQEESLVSPPTKGIAQTGNKIQGKKQTLHHHCTSTDLNEKGEILKSSLKSSQFYMSLCPFAISLRRAVFVCCLRIELGFVYGFLER
jgi:hypothetical protein